MYVTRVSRARTYNGGIEWSKRWQPSISTILSSVHTLSRSPGEGEQSRRLIRLSVWTGGNRSFIVSKIALNKKERKLLGRIRSSRGSTQEQLDKRERSRIYGRKTGGIGGG